MQAESDAPAGRRRCICSSSEGPADAAREAHATRASNVGWCHARRVPRATRPTNPTRTPAAGDQLVSRLGFSIARLARLLRQQDAQGLSPTAGAVLATI